MAAYSFQQIRHCTVHLLLERQVAWPKPPQGIMFFAAANRVAQMKGDQCKVAHKGQT